MMTTLFTDHGAWVLFLWLLGNQAGVPVPVVPPLLAAGALARSNLELMTILAMVVGALLGADVVWYSVGRRRGARALGPLRRSFEWASTRIDRVANLSLARQGVFLMGTRFLPELKPVL